MLYIFSYIYQVGLKHSTIWINEFLPAISRLLLMFYSVALA